MQSLPWIFYAFTQIPLAAVLIDRNIVRGRSGWATLGIISIALWTFLLTACLLSFLSDFWQVDPDGIRYRRFFRTVDIPFTAVTAIRPTRSRFGNLEIELARRGAEVYPHQYLVADPAECENFLKAIEQYAPEITVEA